MKRAVFNNRRATEIAQNLRADEADAHLVRQHPRNRGAGVPIHQSMPNAPVGFEVLLADFYNALWLGELLTAAGHQVDVFPREFDALTTTFFALFRPTVQA
jgi:hypothetical protein